MANWSDRMRPLAPGGAVVGGPVEVETLMHRVMLVRADRH
jgi:hypothetical protein